jgi:cytidylate kinase
LTGTSLIIAIYGPAASGKGTRTRRLAEKFWSPHLDHSLAMALPALMSSLWVEIGSAS